jgi:glycogen(starch) synthase
VLARRQSSLSGHLASILSPRPKVVPVSIVINTLNRRDHLKRTLLALTEQSYPRFEVIVVNGPSVDGTEEMLAAFTGRARLATCDVASLGRSRNIGLELSAGEIVAFTDDDAIPKPEWIERMVAPYQDPSVGAVGGPVFDIPLDTVTWTLCTVDRLGTAETESNGPATRYLGPGADPLLYLPGCNMSFRRSVLVEVGGFNGRLVYLYDDAEIASRVIDAGYTVHVLDDALVEHYRAPNSTRNDQLELRDPYQVLYCRAVFASQCGLDEGRREAVAPAIRTAVDELVRWADDQAAAGRLSAGEHGHFTARAHQGAVDGLAAGLRSRAGAELTGHRKRFLQFG